jgi:hypothetical protein
MAESAPVVEECPPPPFYYERFMDDSPEKMLYAIPKANVIESKLPFRHISSDAFNIEEINVRLSRETLLRLASMVI